VESGGGEQATTPPVRGRLCVWWGVRACVPCGRRMLHVGLAVAMHVLGMQPRAAAVGAARCEWFYSSVYRRHHCLLLSSHRGEGKYVLPYREAGRWC
jgi:hypothetical protein